MRQIYRMLIVLFAALSILAGGSDVLAQGKGKDKDKDRAVQGDGKGKKDGAEKKQHKHHDGKALVGGKIKTNGHHKFHENGKFSAFVDVSKGKISGVKVSHAEKGAVPVKKYKTTKKMAEAPAGGFQPVSFVIAQAYSLGTVWIGYSYYDDYGYEVIYWFPYEMILDGDTGAVDYVPIY